MLSLQYNPVTGKAWTAADVNASMEFGFVGQFAGYSPRVTQAYVEVKYRIPAASTDYVGGIYEKQSDGTETKYYDAGGATAMRVETTAGGALETGANCQNTTDDDGDTIVNDGCPMYLLSDHLGGTTKVLNAAGAIVSDQKYWPYGGLRDGGITQTDKLYTGQQEESGDAALGLYNYKARFYSTVVGRFVSADPVVPEPSDPQSWNSYSYVRNGPLSRIDPTGMADMAPTPESFGCDKRCQLIEAWKAYHPGECYGGCPTPTPVPTATNTPEPTETTQPECEAGYPAGGCPGDRAYCDNHANDCIERPVVPNEGSGRSCPVENNDCVPKPDGDGPDADLDGVIDPVVDKIRERIPKTIVKTACNLLGQLCWLFPATCNYRQSAGCPTRPGY